MPTDVVEILNAVRAEIAGERLNGALLAIYDYWLNRRPGNGTPETDAQAPSAPRQNRCTRRPHDLINFLQKTRQKWSASAERISDPPDTDKRK
jgi:hypothetical protein